MRAARNVPTSTWARALHLQAYFDFDSVALSVLQAALEEGLCGEEESEEEESSQPAAYVPAALFASGTVAALLEGAAMLPMRSRQVGGLPALMCGLRALSGGLRASMGGCVH